MPALRKIVSPRANTVGSRPIPKPTSPPTDSVLVRIRRVVAGTGILARDLPEFLNGWKASNTHRLLNKERLTAADLTPHNLHTVDAAIRNEFTAVMGAWGLRNAGGGLWTNAPEPKPSVTLPEPVAAVPKVKFTPPVPPPPAAPASGGRTIKPKTGGKR